ncbi:Cupin 1 [Dillenia turbinata]|uniref:Germin-like protein n=1 Tax=Dillenia turbinata TaxID=194707 RepID=A0AAN8Z8Z4_9MAGN
MTMSTSHFKPLFFVMLFLLPLTSHCADSDPLQDFCVADYSAKTSGDGFACKPASEVKADDFFFSGLRYEGNTTNKFGTLTTHGDVLSFPALNTLGLSMNRVDFAPGGLNPPHIHPRSSEIVFVVEGTLLAGFLTSKHVLFSKVVNAGDMFVIPRSLVHFQLNIGKTKARTITSFNSQFPGDPIMSTNLFGSTPTIPNEVLTKTFQVDDNIVNLIKSKFSP